MRAVIDDSDIAFDNHCNIRRGDSLFRPKYVLGMKSTKFSDNYNTY